MSKFTLKFEEQSISAVNKSITVEFNALSLNSILNEVTDFLKGCGYRFDGYLDIVENQEVSAGQRTDDSIGSAVSGLGSYAPKGSTVSPFDLNFYDGINISSKNTISHHPV